MVIGRIIGKGIVGLTRQRNVAMAENSRSWLGFWALAFNLIPISYPYFFISYFLFMYVLKSNK